MTAAAWAYGSLLCVLTIVLVILTFVPFFARWNALRYAVLLRVGLPVRLENAVSARVNARDRGAGIGAFVATVLAMLAVHFGIGVSDDTRLTLLLIGGAAAAGGGAGVAVAAFTDAPGIARSGPRIARSGAVTVADYIHPFERYGARTVVVVAAAVSIAGAALGAGGSLFPLAAFATVGVVALGLFEVASRRIVAIGQPAGSTGELVWDDAVRASTLRGMLAAPVAFGGYSLLFGLLRLVETGPAAATAAAADVSGVATSLGVFAFVLYDRIGKPRRHFLDRLWRDLRWADTADAATDTALQSKGAAHD